MMDAINLFILDFTGFLFSVKRQVAVWLRVESEGECFSENTDLGRRGWILSHHQSTALIAMRQTTLTQSRVSGCVIGWSDSS